MLLCVAITAQVAQVYDYSLNKGDCDTMWNRKKPTPVKPNKTDKQSGPQVTNSFIFLNMKDVTKAQKVNNRSGHSFQQGSKNAESSKALHFSQVNTLDYRPKRRSSAMEAFHEDELTDMVPAKPVLRHNSEPASTGNASRIISNAFSFLNDDSDAAQRSIESDFSFLDQLDEEDEVTTIDRRTLGTSISTLDHDHVASVLDKIRQGRREVSIHSEADSDDSDLWVYDESLRRGRYVFSGDYSDSPFQSVSSDGVPLSNDDSDEHSDDSGLFSEDVSSPLTNGDDIPGPSNHRRSESVSTTTSEDEFRAQFAAEHSRVSPMGSRRRIIRRQSSTATYKRISEKVAEPEREALVVKSSGDNNFGFHLLGCHPVLVSTVEKGSAADKASVREGDVLVAVNGIPVLESPLEEVIDLIRKDRSRVTLGLGSGHLKLLTSTPVCSGYLMKLGTSPLLKSWKKRWFELKSDHCLYYYKNDDDSDPLGAIPLHNYVMTKAPEIKRDFAFKFVRYGQRTYFLCAQSEDDMNRWACAIMANSPVNKCEASIDVSSHNVGLPALSIKSPDCHGYLTKIGNSYKTWKRRYCVLKDACLYYYVDSTASTAKGAAHMHGYAVEASLPYNKPNGFSLVPPEPSMRTFYFFADHETDLKRWIAAFRKSIGKWVKVDF